MSEQGNVTIPWLPWIDDNGKFEILQYVELTKSKIEQNNWGVVSNVTENGPSKMHVLDLRGITMMTASLRYILKKLDTAVYYRGQNKAWSLVPSLFRKKETTEERLAALHTMNSLLYHVKKHFSILVEDHVRAALAQHYKCPTNWLDIVDTPQMAAWFAYHQRVSYIAPDNGVAYILLLAAPKTSGNSHVQVIDLRDSEPKWLRPHVQQAFSMRVFPDDGSIGSFDHVHLMTYIVPRPLLKAWSAYDAISVETMFPNSTEDLGRFESNIAQGLLHDTEWKGIWHDPEIEI
ncbi:FRG domain-containing protein [bacterium]|nr:FRG domain-containing protein [bacterium]